MKFVSSKREAIKKKKKVGRFRVVIYDPPYLTRNGRNFVS